MPTWWPTGTRGDRPIHCKPDHTHDLSHQECGNHIFCNNTVMKILFYVILICLSLFTTRTHNSDGCERWRKPEHTMYMVSPRLSTPSTWPQNTHPQFAQSTKNARCRLYSNEWVLELKTFRKKCIIIVIHDDMLFFSDAEYYENGIVWLCTCIWTPFSPMV